MKKIIHSIILLNAVIANAQVGINTATPKGVLDVQNLTGKNYGLVLPKVDNTTSTTTPDGSGLEVATLVYDKADKCIKYKTETAWSKCFLDADQIRAQAYTSAATSNSWVVPPKSPLYDPIQISLVGTTALNTTNFSDALDNNVLQGIGYSVNYAIASQYLINPTSRLFNQPIFNISSGYDGYLLIDQNYKLYGIGYNPTDTFANNSLMGIVPPDLNQLKTYTEIPQSSMVGLSAGEYPIQTIMLGSSASAFVTNQGNVFSTGSSTRNGHGTNVANLANPTTQGANKMAFTKIPGLSNIKSLWGEHTADDLAAFTAVGNDGSVYTWGYNAYTGIPLSYVGERINTLYAPVNISGFFNNATTPSWPSGEVPRKVKVKSGFTIASTVSGRMFGCHAQNMANIGLGTDYDNSNFDQWFELSTNANMPGFMPGDKIIDFDCVNNAIMACTKDKIWYTGADDYERFGNGETKFGSVKWEALPTTQFAAARFAKIKLAPYRTIITTSTVETEGGGRLIGAGYGYNGSLGFTGGSDYIRNARFIVR